MTLPVREAFLLAAGLGTRMRPLTDHKPKALIEVAGKALIDHMLEALFGAGVERFVVNAHYKSEQLIEHLATLDFDIQISLEQEKPLETGGGLKFARHHFGDNPIFVANTDSLWIEPKGREGQGLENLKALYAKNDCDAALLVAPMNRSSGFDGAGDFYLDDQACLQFRNDALTAPYNFTGVHITHPDIVTHETETVFSLSRIWRERAKAGLLKGTVLEGQWLHVGDPEARDQAEIIMKAAS